jgi:Fumarylacetoacetate (FAA) hydrolase family
VHGLAEPHSLVEALRGGQDVLQLAAETALTSPDEVIPAAQVVPRPGAGAAIDPRPHGLRRACRDLDEGDRAQRGPGLVSDPDLVLHKPRGVYGLYAPVAPGSAAFDYELEVAVVIGKEGSNIPVRNAADYITGYTVPAIVFHYSPV